MSKQEQAARKTWPWATIFFLVLLVLKLIPGTAVYDWSWWWVTAPLWGPIALFFAFLVIAVIIAAIAVAFKQKL